MRKAITLRCFITHNSVVIVQQHNEIKTKKNKNEMIDCFTLSKSEVLILVFNTSTGNKIKNENGECGKEKTSRPKSKKTEAHQWAFNTVQ